MRAVGRCVVVTIAVLHGLIHLLGPAEAFGWADVDTIREPIDTIGGVGSLAASVLLVATGLLLAFRVRWWWIVGTVAVTLSQAVIVTSWDDARAGTVANVILVVAVLYGFAAEGPAGLRSEYRHRASAALARPGNDDLVTEADLSRLPAPVADHVRRSGAVGRPHVRSFRARIHGRIRGGPTKPWMTFTGEQVNTYGPEPGRLLSMDATMSGLPVDVLHVYERGSATMRARVCSVVPVVDGSGPEMDRAETVTLFNDLCVLTPAALVDAPIDWQAVDDHRARGTFTAGMHSVSADLIFDDDHDLVDFVSDDRLRSSPDGSSFTRQRWSTPVGTYRQFGARRIAAVGEGRWHAPEPEGEFAYLEFIVDEIVDDVGATDR